LKTSVLVGLIIAAIAIGGIGLYYGTTTSVPLASPTEILASTVTSAVSTASSGPNPQSGVGESCNSSGCTVTSGPTVPKSEWGSYLGFIPQGYVIAPKALAAFVFPCPAGMTQSQCALFTQTCGDGVCNPNETCQSCPVDCTVPGDLSCDPYTGRAAAPATLCQIGIANQAAYGNPEPGA
jgi:hypothetical protein